MVCVAWSHPQGRWDVRTPDETLMRQALALRHSHDSVDTRSNHAAAVWPLIFGLQRLGRSPPRSRWRSFRRPGPEKTRRRISLQPKEREALVAFCAPWSVKGPHENHAAFQPLRSPKVPWGIGSRLETAAYVNSSN
jgi:hypothetical protein